MCVVGRGLKTVCAKLGGLRRGRGGCEAACWRREGLCSGEDGSGRGFHCYTCARVRCGEGVVGRDVLHALLPLPPQTRVQATLDPVPSGEEASFVSGVRRFGMCRRCVSGIIFLRRWGVSQHGALGGMSVRRGWGGVTAIFFPSTFGCYHCLQP